MFPDLEYIRWIEGRPSAATHDLGSSDLDLFASDGDVSEALSDVPQAPEDRSLQTLIADRFEVPEERVVPAAGATHANVLATLAALDHADEEDDRILVEKPGYEPLRETPKLFGARIDRFLRKREADSALVPDRIRGAITDRTALVTVTNRHNPTGRLADRDRLRAVADVTSAADVPLLVDEVYGPFVTDPETEGPFGGVTAVGIDGVVVTGSLTKFHGLGPLRVGWLIGPPEFADSARKAARHIPALAEPSAHLGRRVLGAPAATEPRARDRVTENHALLSEFVEERADLSGPVHPGSTFAFLEHETADGDAVVEAAWDEGILVVPGRFFEADAAFRVSVGGPPDESRAALSAFESVLDGLTGV